MTNVLITTVDPTAFKTDQRSTNGPNTKHKLLSYKLQPSQRNKLSSVLLSEGTVNKRPNMTQNMLLLLWELTSCPPSAQEVTSTGHSRLQVMRGDVQSERQEFHFVQLSTQTLCSHMIELALSARSYTLTPPPT